MVKHRIQTSLETKILFRSVYLSQSGINIEILSKIYHQAFEMVYALSQASSLWEKHSEEVVSKSEPKEAKRNNILALWTQSVIHGILPENIYNEAIKEFTEDGLMNLTIAVTEIKEMIEEDFFYPDREF